MRDRIDGAEVPTEKQVEALVAEIEGMQARIEGFTRILSNAERLRAPKMRTGGESIVTTLAELADHHGLVLPEVTTAGMTASLTLAKRLRPLAEASRQMTRQLDDTITGAQGDCWWAATALYTALARVANARSELEVALKPIVSFFAKGKRKKGPVTPPVDSAA